MPAIWASQNPERAAETGLAGVVAAFVVPKEDDEPITNYLARSEKALDRLAHLLQSIHPLLNQMGVRCAPMSPKDLSNMVQELSDEGAACDAWEHR